MTPAQYIAAAAAAILVAGPAVWKAVQAGGWRVPPAPASSPSFEQAVSNLSKVRLRLLGTEKLGEAEKAAIDTLTLALVSGSDR